MQTMMKWCFKISQHTAAFKCWRQDNIDKTIKILYIPINTKQFKVLINYANAACRAALYQVNTELLPIYHELGTANPIPDSIIGMTNELPQRTQPTTMNHKEKLTTTNHNGPLAIKIRTKKRDICPFLPPSLLSMFGLVVCPMQCNSTGQSIKSPAWVQLFLSYLPSTFPYHFPSPSPFSFPSHSLFPSPSLSPSHFPFPSPFPSFSPSTFLFPSPPLPLFLSLLPSFFPCPWCASHIWGFISP